MKEINVVAGVENIFKPHIVGTKQYKGGSTRDEVDGDMQFYKLSSNENMLGPSPMAMQAIKDNIANLHEYSFQSDEKFREALEVFYNHDFSADQFITANSGIEMIELIGRAFLEPGLEFIISTPTFLAYKNISELQGGTCIDVPLNPIDFSVDVEGILNAVNSRTRLLFLGTPNNPTGTYLTKEDADKIIYNLPPHVVVVYDEVYYHFTDKDDFKTAASYVKEGRNVIAMHSFSKAYGLAGIRLGYGFSTPEIAGYLNRTRRPFMINTLTMEAGMAALKDVEHIEKTRALIHSEKYHLYSAFDKADVKYWKTEANFILFKTLMDSQEFTEKMLKKGVMVRTTDVFALPQHIRVTIGTREANDAFIKALNEILKPE